MRPSAPVPIDTGRRTGAEVLDVTVPVPDRPAVPAYLVRPAGPAFPDGAPAVLFLHWFDPRATDGDRTEFVAEAVRLAARGVVSLLPQQGFPWTGDPVGDARDVAAVEAELARAAALSLQPVDAVRTVAAHRPVLLQFADDDGYVDADVRARFAATAAETRVYPHAGHHLDRAALTDRTAWLDWVLRLPG